jgi:predicted MFS family arabinose efflux permease
MTSVNRGTRMAILPAQAGPALVLELLAPVVPGIATHFGPDGTAAAQQVVTFPFLGLMIGSILSGVAIRVLGLRLLLQLSFFAWIVTGLIGLLAPNLPLLLVGSILMGLSTALFTSGLAAVTSILFDDAERARMVGLQSGVAHVVGITMTVLSAALAVHYGWRMPYLAIMTFGAVMLTLTTCYIGTLPRLTAKDRLPAWTILSRIWPHCLAGMTVFLIATNLSTQIPFLLAQHGMESASMRSLVTIATPTAGILGAFIFNRSIGKAYSQVLIVGAGISCALGWLIFWQWRGGLPLAICGTSLIGLGIGIFTPTIFSRLMKAVPGESTGMAMGLLNIAIFTGCFLNPLFSVPLRNAAGQSGMMIWVAAATLAAALIAASMNGGRKPATLI